MSQAYSKDLISIGTLIGLGVGFGQLSNEKSEDPFAESVIFGQSMFFYHMIGSSFFRNKYIQLLENKKWGPQRDFGLLIWLTLLRVNLVVDHKLPDTYVYMKDGYPLYTTVQ